MDSLANQPPRLHSDAPRRENVGAVVVTYHPDDGILDRLQRILPQVSALVVVDNHSNPDAASRLRPAECWPNTTIIWNARNLGIATALNQGVRRLRDQGFDWAMTFDQDSVASDRIVVALAEAYRSCAFGDSVGVIGVNYRNSTTGTPAFPLDRFGEQLWQERDTVITSGSLMSLAVFDAVGPFCEPFFIDAVDEEYCLRLRRHGYRVLLTREPLLTHSLGNYTPVRLGRWTLAYTNHSPLRRYYVTRNRLALARDYLLTEPRCVIDRLRRVLQEAVCIALFEQSKVSKLTAMLRGVWHFSMNRMGPLHG